jgi:tetratricopeptide (TPR) repeat protein
MGHLRVVRPDQENNERRLESWKEIAGFFERDEKTVRRWEKDLGLPVHRLPGVSKGRVYAFAHELTEWSNRPRESKAEAAAESNAETAGPLLSLVLPADLTVPPLPKPSVFHRLPLTLLAASLLIVLAALGTWSSFRNGSFSLASVFAVFHGGSPRVPSHRSNPEAERLYLEGRYYWNERTAAGLTRALDDFTQAIVLDPQDAKAYVGLADAYSLIREFTPMPADEALPRAQAAAEKAVALDPNLAEAHRALAFSSFWWKEDVPTMRREFELAIALNPNDATAHLWYANILIDLGESDHALEEINRAQDLDPSSSSIRADKGLLLYQSGHKDEALTLLRQMKKNEPAFISPHRYLAQIDRTEGDFPDYFLEAEETARLMNRPDDQRLVEGEKQGFARSGPRGVLEGRLTVQKQLYAEEKIPAYFLAQTSAKLGNKAEALEYLKTSSARHERYIRGLGADPDLAILRGDPAYQQLVAEVGLPR